MLLAGAALARRPGTAGRVGAGIATLVGVAFLGGSTANLPNDFAAAELAGTPLALTAGLAVIHLTAVDRAALQRGAAPPWPDAAPAPEAPAGPA